MLPSSYTKRVRYEQQRAVLSSLIYLFENFNVTNYSAGYVF